MRIKWDRLIALVLVTTAAVLLIGNRNEVVGFLTTMKHVGPGHSPEQLTIGLMAFGLSVVAILAALKIALNANDKDQP